MTAMETSTRSTKIANATLMAVALLLAATTAYILIDPVSPSDFEATTGVDWTTFSAANPEAADYLSREARLLAVGWLGLHLVVAATVWLPLRKGEDWAKKLLWLYPISLLAAGLVFLGGGGAALGGMYLAVAVVTGLALPVSGRAAGGG